ncbi:hypothetical protein S245_026574 [Arachis hypogaea]
MDSQSQVAVALALSLLGGLSTSFGALFVVINPAPNLKMLGLLQGYAAGLMLSISFFDLAHNALNSLGFLKGKLWFFAGVLFFGVVANFIPEPTLAPISTDKSRKRYQIFMNIIASLKLEKWGWRRQRYHEKASANRYDRHLVSINVFFSISLHNFPEGMAVFLGPSCWPQLGVGHCSAQYPRAYLFPSSLDPEILEGLLGSVGGVMAFLTLHEMLPLAFDYVGQRQSVKAVFFGMAFMSASINVVSRLADSVTSGMAAIFLHRLCLGAWSDHGERTGGFYDCNRYEAAKQEGVYDETERRREMAKNSLERYTHYYERWASSQSSRQKALADLHQMQTVHIEKLSDTQCQPESQLKFITEAWLQIVECGRVLKWTYAYGYYLPEHEHAKKQFFEYLQGEAESGLERLHQCAEKELQ